jgi:Superinfection immunity protein
VDVVQALVARLVDIWNTLSGVSVLWALLAVVFALALYFLPTIFAIVLGHPPGRVTLIGVLNLFLGWTGILWFVLLGWAMIGRPKPVEEGPAEEPDMVPFYHTPGTN